MNNRTRNENHRPSCGPDVILTCLLIAFSSSRRFVDSRLLERISRLRETIRCELDFIPPSFSSSRVCKRVCKIPRKRSGTASPVFLNMEMENERRKFAQNAFNHSLSPSVSSSFRERGDLITISATTESLS